MHEAILQLIADLYRQIMTLQQENAQLKARIAELETPVPTSDPEPRE